MLAVCPGQSFVHESWLGLVCDAALVGALIGTLIGVLIVVENP